MGNIELETGDYILTFEDVFLDKSLNRCMGPVYMNGFQFRIHHPNRGRSGSQLVTLSSTS
jgi:hypothetical protein